MKIKILAIVLCISLIIISLTCSASVKGAVGLDQLQNPDLYKTSADDNSGAIPIGNTIVWLVRTVGESIAVIMLLVIGIKYILGSVEEKAEYKQSMWPYVLGAVLIFAGAALTNVIYQAFN